MIGRMDCLVEARSVLHKLRWIGVCLLAFCIGAGTVAAGEADRRADSGRRAGASPRVSSERSASKGDVELAVGEARLPLERLIELVEEVEKAKQTDAPTPPVAASLQRVQLEGSLLQDALDLSVHVSVVVLEDRGWTRTLLLELGDGAHLGELPEVHGGMLSLEQGKLYLVARKARRYDLDLRLLQRALRKGDRRTAAFRVPEDAPSELRLRFASGLFRLIEEPLRQDAEGALFLPTEGAFEVVWQPLEEEPAAEAEPAPAAAADPTIPHAYASSVSTLEGARITRVAYTLRFAGRRSLQIDLPPGERVQYAYLNGRSVPFEVVVQSDADETNASGASRPSGLAEPRATQPDAKESNAVDDGASPTSRGPATVAQRVPEVPDTVSVVVQVTPERSGGDRATLELVLLRDVPNFLLSGALQVQLPTPAWPVSELVLDVHLPDVFEYTWAGGSLSPTEPGPLGSFVYEIPRPGKRLSFHQYLVRRSTPDVTLGYAVDLAGRYFD